MESYIAILIQALVFALLFAYFNHLSNKRPKIGDGAFIFRMPLLVGIIGVLSVIAGIATAIYGFLWGDYQTQDFWWILLGVVLMVGLGIPLILVTWIQEIRLDDEAIVQRTLLGKIRKIHYEEIEAITFGLLSQQLKITKGSTHIKCHRYTIGFADLLKIIQAKNPQFHKISGLK